MWRHSLVAREELAAFQLDRLQRIVTHAYCHVPYYRRLFDRVGFRPEHLRSVEDLAVIPVTSKEELRAQPLDELLARTGSRKRLVPNRTSGTTGGKFEFLRSYFENQLGNMFRIRAQREFGLRATDKLAHVAGVFPRRRRKRTRIGRIRHGLGIYRRYCISCMQPAQRLLEELERLDPDVMIAYPSVLSHLAHFIATGNHPRIRPRFLMSGAESLIPPMRRRIEESFGVPLFDIYGSFEFHTLAWQCVETGLFHICDENVVVEILEDGVPVMEGERGEVVVTGLQYYAMPFIRYRQEDIATRGPDQCPCGRPFSTLHSIQGRMLNYYHLPGGGALHHYALSTHLMNSAREWTSNYQIVQERIDRISIRVVPARDPSADELQRLKLAGQERLGPGIDFDVVIVDDISADSSGKSRSSVSLLKSDYDGFDWESL